MDVEKRQVPEVATRRQQFARDFGAHGVLNPKPDDVVAKVRELSGGRGADVVFDCTGSKTRSGWIPPAMLLRQGAMSSMWPSGRRKFRSNQTSLSSRRAITLQCLDIRDLIE